MLKCEKIKKEFENMSEKEFQRIFYNSKYYEKLIEKDWLLELKINNSVVTCECHDGMVFFYGMITKISKKYFTVVDHSGCESYFDRKSGKIVDKYIYVNRFGRKLDNRVCSWSEGTFLCRPQDWMERIRKEHRKRMEYELLMEHRERIDMDIKG